MRQVLKVGKHSIKLLLSGRLVSSGLPWLRERGFPLPMSLAAYAFDVFKRQRMEMLPRQSLDGCSGRAEKGLVSIVLPVYNGERYLPEALESVLCQSYTNWELIAVNDGSTDRSGGILTEYADRDPRIRILTQENQRLPRSLSNGFKLASGEFYTWISDDNQLHPDFLAKMVMSLKHQPAWDMIYANQKIIGDLGEPLRDSPFFRTYQKPFGSEYIHLPKDPSELNTLPNNYIGAAFLYRQRVAALVGDYDPFRYTTEDYDYWLRVNALLNLRHADFDEPILSYRFHHGSLTSRDQELKINENRSRLLVFDDFRRDFYLRPLTWWVEDAGGPLEGNPAELFRQQVLSARQELGNGQLPENLPRLWFPVVYVRFTSGADQGWQPEQKFPPGALKVLVHYGKAVASEQQLDEMWDLQAIVYGNKDAMDFHILPPGWLAVPDIPTLLTAVDIWARSRHLELIAAEAERPGRDMYRASIVICTNRGQEFLEPALISAAGQDFPPDQYEVLIVNNNPDTDTIESELAGMRERFFAGREDRLKLVNSPIRGLSHARNSGISEAKGALICFLDDDAHAHQQWLNYICQAFDSHPEVGIVGGEIFLQKPDPLPRWWLPGMESFWSGNAPGTAEFSFVDRWQEFPWGANWCARRTMLVEMGGFRTRYGRQGGNYQGGEEIVAAFLAQKLGYRVGIEARAKVIHAVDPSRFTLRNVLRALIGGRRSWYQAQMDLYMPSELGVRQSLQRIWKSLWPLSIRSLVKLVYTLVAEIMLFNWRLRDLFRRFRKPEVIT